MGRHTSDTGGGDFTPAPEGTHIARCIELIDIGHQHGEYQGEKNVREQVIIRWELPTETIEIDGSPEPMIVSKFYTNSLGEKANLRADLEAWRGRKFTPEELGGFDLNNILGKPCFVTVVHNDKKKAKVTGVTGLPKGTTCPPQVKQSKAFWIEEWDGNTNSGPFAELPNGFQKMIKESDEYKALMSPDTKPRQPEGVDTEDIPF